jgi:hypothetical protein
LETPSAATVSAGESRGLSPGQPFTFQLRFDRAPEGYGSGTITYSFQSEQVPPSAGLNPRGEQASYTSQTELHDGQAIYNLKIIIDDQMVPGMWKLVAVSIGRTLTKPVTIPKDVTFEIRQPSPVAIHVHAPGSVRAGQRFVFTVDFDGIPKEFSSNCVLGLAGSLRSVGPLGPDGRPTPGGYGVPVSGSELSPEKRSYEMSGSFPPDLPGGAWQGDVQIYAHPNRPSTMWFCRTPPVEGDTHFSFVLEPAPDLVTPTSVDVTVNPSQIQLLLGEADRLRAKAEQLNGQLHSGDMAANKILLQTNLQDAMSDVDSTEAKYKEIGADPSPARVVGIFFDDIRFGYGEALRTLDNSPAHSSVTKPRLDRVSAALAGSAPHLDRASSAVLASILHNAKAYEVVASSKAMTFTLDVYSDPPGATISYRLREGEYQILDHETDWHIENLTRAVYFVRLQKPGYEDREITFDAIDNSRTSVKISLDKRATR